MVYARIDQDKQPWGLNQLPASLHLYHQKPTEVSGVRKPSFVAAENALELKSIFTSVHALSMVYAKIYQQKRPWGRNQLRASLHLHHQEPTEVSAVRKTSFVAAESAL